MLTPIGEYRAQYVQPSKGKRAKRRKLSASQKKTKGDVVGDSTTGHQQNPMPPAPTIASSLVIGFNSTVRCLETEARKNAPPAIAELNDGLHGDNRNNPSGSVEAKPLIAVFVARSEQSPVMVSHLPLLVATASLNRQSEAAIRLITLPKGAGATLSTALQLPRVGIIGLRGDAPNIAPLIAHVRDTVAPVEVPWLHGLQIGRYLPTKIKAIVTTTTVKQKQKASPDGVRKK